MLIMSSDTSDFVNRLIVWGVNIGVAGSLWG